MSELLVFLAAEDACDWMLVTTDPSSPASGNATRIVDLPPADRVNAIVPAAAMRTLVLRLPPTPADKRQSVVRFALEDQLAGDIDAQHVVIAAERERDVVVHAIDRGWLSHIVHALAAKGLRPSGIFAESDLAPHRPHTRSWIWHEDGGFLIEPSGRVSILDRGADALPSGLLLALRNGGPGEGPVVIHGPPSLADNVDGWSRATGVAFELAPAWRWRDIDRAQLPRAPNLLTPELESGAAVQSRERRVDWLSRAAAWAAAAALLHTGASIADWVALKWRAAQLVRETTAMIQAAAPALAGDLDAGWRRTFAAARHRQGRTAPDDALPLIADAALGLTALPPGALRVINYEAGQLTLDFAGSASPAIAAALPAWNARGLSVLQADAAGGVRVRLTRQ